MERTERATTASGVIAFVQEGRERSGLHVVTIAEGRLSWTVAAPNGREAVTLASDDPAVLAFVRRLLDAGYVPAA